MKERAPGQTGIGDRATQGWAFAAALLLHGLVLLVAGHQYVASASDPSRLNQAARQLPKVVQGKPIRYVYVRDMIPSPEPPQDPTRLSDMNRRGASPDPRKGTSPDPTSFGRSPVRQTGGPGDAPVTRPAVPPSPGSHPATVPLPPSRGSSAGPGARGQQGEEKGPEKNTAAKPNAGRVEETQMGKPATALKGLPLSGPVEGGSRGVPEAAGAPPSRGPSPRGPGIASQLQKMMVGSLQGGYSNPNASRLNSGALSFDTAAWDLGPYARQVQEKVESNWRIPGAQEVLRQKGWVAIRFTIQKNGAITDLALERPSGIPSYDQAALNALISSNPLPPLPSEVTAPSLGALFRFFYNLPPEE